MSSKEVTKVLWPFSIDQSIGWFCAMGVGIATLTTYFFQTFETKDSFNDYRMSQERYDAEIIKRLDRMDSKLDDLLKRD